MKKSRIPFFHRAISGLLAAIVFCSTALPVQASIFFFDSTPPLTPENAVTVSIEKPTDGGTYLCEPTLVSLDGNESIKASTALTQAYAPLTVKENIINNSISVQDLTIEGGVLADTGKNYSGEFKSEAHWIVIINSRYQEGVFTRLASTASAGDVIRLVYTTNDGEDIGYNNEMMQVNKDSLLKLIAGVSEEDLKQPTVKTAYEKALAVGKHSAATKTEVQQATDQLNAALHPTVPATDIQVTPEQLQLQLGDSAKLTAKALPENTTDTISFRSENTGIATVDKDGTVTAVSLGNATITVSAGSISRSVPVSVTAPDAQSISLDQQSVSLTEGESVTLKATVTPVEAASNLKWESNNPEVATVSSNGLVVAQSAGTATITASANGKQASCTVTVHADLSEDVKVVFTHSDGRQEELTDNVLTLTMLDEGSFSLKNYSGSYTPYWEATDENGKIRVSSKGEFCPRGLTDGITVSAYTRSPSLYEDAELIERFTLQVETAHIEEMRVFTGDTMLTMTQPFIASGSTYYPVSVSVRRTGNSFFESIPDYAFYLTIEDPDTGDASSYSNDFCVNSGEQAIFTVHLIDNSFSSQFWASGDYSPVTGLNIQMPETWEISGWNGLGNQYSGLQPNLTSGCVVETIPATATNTELKWESLTPKVAEYQATFSNGIVPKKAGVATFRITSMDNPEISQEFSINLIYSKPVTNVTLSEANITIEKGSSLEIPYLFSPQDATEQRFNYEISQDNIIQIQETVSQDSSSVYAPVITSHSLYVKNLGTVTVTATPFNQTGGASPITFTVKVVERKIEQDSPAIEEMPSYAKHGLSLLISDQVTRNQYGDEWTIFPLLRSGVSPSETEKADYYKSVCEQVSDPSLKPTYISRIVLTLLAMGKDPTNVNGINLIELLYSNEKLQNYSSNMAIWTLIALDANDYAIPDNAIWSRDSLIKLILTYQKQDGGFGLSSENITSVDMTAMAMQSLAPYTYRTDVKNAIAKAEQYLQERLTINAGFVEGGSENSCTAAQVLIALTALGIDPLDEDNGYTRGDKNLLTNLYSFKTESGFKTYQNSSDEALSVMLMSTQQVTMALESYQRFLNGEPSLYKVTDPYTGDNTGDGGDTDNGGNTGNGSNNGNGGSTNNGGNNDQWWLVYPQTPPPAFSGSVQHSTTVITVTPTPSATPSPTAVPEEAQGSETAPAETAQSEFLPIEDEPVVDAIAESATSDTESNRSPVIYFVGAGVVIVICGAAWFVWKKKH